MKRDDGAHGYEIMNMLILSFLKMIQLTRRTCTLMIKDQFCFSFSSQVLEYHPEPFNAWVEVANLEKETGTLLRCLSDEGNNQFISTALVKML